MNEYELTNEITVITNKTRDYLLSNNPDALILYLFYIKSSEYQGTNSVWITDGFVMEGLKWGKSRVTSAKNFLLENNLIELHKQRFENGTYGKTYIRIKYLWKQETKNSLIQRNPIQEYQNPQVVKPTAGFGETNALSNININALSREDTPKIKKQASLEFLLDLDEDTIQEMTSKFNCTRKQVVSKAEDLYDWALSSGKKKKDYKALLRVAIRSDYGERKSYLDLIREENPDVIIAQ
jgi:hypothetical protein